LWCRSELNTPEKKMIEFINGTNFAIFAILLLVVCACGLLWYWYCQCSDCTGEIRGPVYTPKAGFLKRVQQYAKGESPPQDYRAFMDLVNGVIKSRHSDLRLEYDRIYYARASCEMYRLLWNFASALNQGHFELINGQSTALIVGTKGIGKTTAIRMFVHFAHLAFHDIVPVYVNFEAVSSTVLEKNSLLDAVCNSLNLYLGWGIKPKKLDEGLGMNLIDKLRERNRRLFLVVDEFDKYYQCSPEKHAIQTLDELSALANTKCGRIVALACGSSSFLENLIRGKGPKRMYPLLEQPRDINGSKFHSERVYSTLPTDLESVQEILGSDVPIETVRIVTFIVGANARYVTQVRSATQSEGVYGSGSISFSNDDVDERTQCLWEKMMKRFWEKNEISLKRLLTAEKQLDLELVKSYDFTEFQPLDYAEICELWKGKVIVDKPGNGIEVPDLDDCLRVLSDKSRVIWAEIQNKKPKAVYPPSIHHVVAKHEGKTLDPSMLDKIRRSVVHPDQALKSVASMAIKKVV